MGAVRPRLRLKLAPEGSPTNSRARAGDAWKGVKSLRVSSRRLPEFRLELGRQYRLPVALHADHGPATLLGFIERLVELADFRSAVIRELTVGVVVVQQEQQAPR